MARMYLGILALSIGMNGCGVVKRNADSKRMMRMSQFSTKMKNEEAELKMKENAGKLFIQHDSAKLAFKVEIWPRGPFNYSPYKGFEGTAEKIIWHGEGKQLSRMLGMQDVQLQVESKEKSNLDATEVTSKLEKTEDKVRDVSRSPSWKWIGTAVVVLILVLVWFLKKII